MNQRPLRCIHPLSHICMEHAASTDRPLCIACLSATVLLAESLCSPYISARRIPTPSFHGACGRIQYHSRALRRISLVLRRALLWAQRSIEIEAPLRFASASSRVRGKAPAT
jgi:hypothetical protein